MSQPVRVLISVVDEQIDQMQSVATALRAAGVNVEKTLAALGTIIGSVDEDRIDAVAHVPGVGHVEREQPISIAPADSEHSK